MVKKSTKLAVKEMEKLDAPLIARLTQEQKDLIKRQYAKYATDDELAIYYNFCEKAGVDPMRGQSHFIKYNATAKPIMMIGIDGFQARATSDPRYEGMVANAVYDNDNFSMNPVEGIITHSFGVKDRGKIAGAYAILKRKGMIPAIQWILFSEYNSPGKDNWKNMPEVMITKVARATLLRREYPDNFSGVYVPEEFGMEITEDGNMEGAIDITSKEYKHPADKFLEAHNKKLKGESSEPAFTSQTDSEFRAEPKVTIVIEPIDIPEQSSEETEADKEFVEPKPKKRGRPKKEEVTPIITASVEDETPDTSTDPKDILPGHEQEPDEELEPDSEPGKFKCELQLSPSIIEKMSEAETPREAFKIMEKYAFDGQGHHFKALVKEYCPEYFEKGYALFQIPESAVIVMVKKASGVKFKKSEKTPDCKTKKCKNKLTEPEAEQRDGKCHECFKGDTEDE